jgi:hypothetical protein
VPGCSQFREGPSVMAEEAVALAVVFVLAELKARFLPASGRSQTTTSAASRISRSSLVLGSWRLVVLPGSLTVLVRHGWAAPTPWEGQPMKAAIQQSSQARYSPGSSNGQKPTGGLESVAESVFQQRLSRRRQPRWPAAGPSPARRGAARLARGGRSAPRADPARGLAKDRPSERSAQPLLLRRLWPCTFPSVTRTRSP